MSQTMRENGMTPMRMKTGLIGPDTLVSQASRQSTDLPLWNCVRLLFVSRSSVVIVVGEHCLV